ncbi:unnamed protein product, partial [marine sediment metagenome]
MVDDKGQHAPENGSALDGMGAFLGCAGVHGSPQELGSASGLDVPAVAGVLSLRADQLFCRARQITGTLGRDRSPNKWRAAQL